MSLGGTVNNNLPICSLSSKKQRIYDDFSNATKIRQNQLIAEGKTLFVNLGYLAEYSTYFANSYEQNVNSIVLDKPYEDVLELMRCMFFCPQRKPITHANINTIVELAAYFDMEPVLKRCEDVISNQAGSFSPNRLFQLTRTLSHHQRNSLSMSVLVDKLARMDDNQLSTLPFGNIPGDVVADLYAVKLRQSQCRNFERKKKPLWTQGCCFWLSNTDDNA